jgi:hypothetical protein
MYYLLSANPRCIRHTVAAGHLRTERDRFWVDLPVIYLYDSDKHLEIAQAIEVLGEGHRAVPLDELRQNLSGDLKDEDILIHTYLRPMSGQRLIIHEKDAYSRHVYRLGEGWARQRRYLEAVREDPAHPVPRSLPALVKTHPDWFRHEQWDFA